MSRTDKDHPRGKTSHKVQIRVCRRKKQRHDRQAIRIELQQKLPIGVDYCPCGFTVEPRDHASYDGLAVPATPPAQHRHAALWDAW